jgi:serine/threonine-protein kinase
MLKPGDTFERYEVEDSIGQGGMGRVYRAHDVRLGRRVALKVLSETTSGTEGGARMLREARAAAALDHPNAVAIFDVGEHDGAPYIVMELVSGRTLRSAIEAADAPLRVRVGWLTDAARALAAAHRKGIVHRDIKPENVMVRDDGVVKVLDFGIARRAGGSFDPSSSTHKPALPTLTVDGTKLGTPVYMAPEQVRGEELDGRADQFAWGVLAYELLTGRLPWRGSADAFAVVASILTDEPDEASLEGASVPPEVRAVVLRALAKRPSARFASMEDVVRALEAIGKGEALPDAERLPPARAKLPEEPGAADRAPGAGAADRAPGAGAADRASGADAPEKKQSATEAQRFSTEEVRDVLVKALEQQAKRGDGKLTYDDVLSAAKEVDIDEESLREASRALRGREGDALRQRDYNAWLRRRRADLIRHAGVYVIVNFALLIIAYLVVPAFAHYAFVLPLLWGIGLAIHALVTATANEDEWEEEKEGMQWWREEMRRRHEVVMVRAALGNERAWPGKSSTPAPRVPVTPAEVSATARATGGPRGALTPEKIRVRVDPDTGRERAAEEEAALEEEEGRARGKKGKGARR